MPTAIRPRYRAISREEEMTDMLSRNIPDEVIAAADARQPDSLSSSLDVCRHPGPECSG
jgi:hypothetical protein